MQRYAMIQRLAHRRLIAADIGVNAIPLLLIQIAGQHQGEGKVEQIVVRIADCFGLHGAASQQRHKQLLHFALITQSQGIQRGIADIVVLSHNQQKLVVFLWHMAGKQLIAARAVDAWPRQLKEHVHVVHARHLR